MRFERLYFVQRTVRVPEVYGRIQLNSDQRGADMPEILPINMRVRVLLFALPRLMPTYPSGVLPLRRSLKPLGVFELFLKLLPLPRNLQLD